MKFKVGDRVNVYGQVGTGLGCYFHNPYKGKVDFIASNTEIGVILDAGYKYSVHPKQCRKLKPKVKKELKRIYLPANVTVGELYKVFGDDTKLLDYLEIECGYNTIEFVEVKKK